MLILLRESQVSVFVVLGRLNRGVNLGAREVTRAYRGSAKGAILVNHIVAIRCADARSRRHLLRRCVERLGVWAPGDAGGDVVSKIPALGGERRDFS
jgi:hypothetical protein